MDNSRILSRRGQELFNQIKWIVLARGVFALILIFSTFFFSDTELQKAQGLSFLSLYRIAGTILGLTFAYHAWLMWKTHLTALAYVQIIIDTFIVTAIVFVTGCFNSIFTFLYLLIIIYAAMLLLARGSFVVPWLQVLNTERLLNLNF